MKISLKKALAVLVAGVSGLGAMTASADVALSSTGNGELTLFVRNDVTGDTYARGLQVFMNDVMTQSAIVALNPAAGVANQARYVLPTIAPDANLTTFLAQAGTFTWTVMAGDNTQAIALGDKRYLVTTPRDLSTGTDRSNANLAVGFNNLNQMLITLNTRLPDAGGSSIMTDGQWRQVGATPGSGGGDYFSQSLNTINDVGVGSPANFYMLTTGQQFARVIQFSDLTLSADGTLSAVPLPAAVWLLGSGLIGLAGVGRRRKLV